MVTNLLSKHIFFKYNLLLFSLQWASRTSSLYTHFVAQYVLSLLTIRISFSQLFVSPQVFDLPHQLMDLLQF